MKDYPIQGTVVFVNHEKKYLIIEYDEKGRKKNVNAGTDEKKKGGPQPKHRFQPGDEVSFSLDMGTKSARPAAINVKFLYNTSLDQLINRAKTENKFTGYIKVAEGKYFIKEIDSYLFFPLHLSPWQIPPAGKELNDAVSFMLEHPEKKEKITARLYNNRYIPEFHHAVKAFKNKTTVEADVYKVSPHGIYVKLFGGKISSKFPAEQTPAVTYLLGDRIKVLITYLSPQRIVTVPA
jgi:hypothetical protein